MSKKPKNVISGVAQDLRTNHSSAAGRKLAHHRHGTLTDEQALAIVGLSTIAGVALFDVFQRRSNKRTTSKQPQPYVAQYPPALQIAEEALQGCSNDVLDTLPDPRRSPILGWPTPGPRGVLRSLEAAELEDDDIDDPDDWSPL